MKATLSWLRAKDILMTPPVFPEDRLRLQTNLDTDFLKLIAIVSMLIDHIGGVFFRKRACSAGLNGWRFPSSVTV